VQDTSLAPFAIAAMEAIQHRHEDSPINSG
jgi:hypothetical protein